MDFDVPIQTSSHVVISLVAIVSGAIVSYGFLAAKQLDIWTAVFLVTTVLTSVTGFIFFPIERFTPALGVGAISLMVLAVAILGRYRYHLAGRWRAAYVISSVTAFFTLCGTQHKANYADWLIGQSLLDVLSQFLGFSSRSLGQLVLWTLHNTQCSRGSFTCRRA